MILVSKERCTVGVMVMLFGKGRKTERPIAMTNRMRGQQLLRLPFVCRGQHDANGNREGLPMQRRYGCQGQALSSMSVKTLSWGSAYTWGNAEGRAAMEPPEVQSDKMLLLRSCILIHRRSGVVTWGTTEKNGAYISDSPLQRSKTR